MLEVVTHDDLQELHMCQPDNKDGTDREPGQLVVTEFNHCHCSYDDACTDLD